MSKRAAIYVRVSSKEQEEGGTSLESQEKACRQHVHQHTGAVADEHVFRETHTGIELWERPKLTALRDVIRRKQVDMVVVYAIDRLARDPVHLGVILTEADHADVAVEFVTEPLDNSPEGQLIRFVRGYAAKVEHEKIRERTVRGKRSRVESGKLAPGPRALYGYQWRDASRSALVIDELPAVIVRRIYQEYLGRRALRKIAIGLIEDGIPTPTGKGPVWNTSTVKKILSHPYYCGIAAGFAQTHGNSWRFDIEHAIILPEGTVPPIVSRQTWEAVQAQFQRNLAQSVRNCKYPEAALLRGGYVRCGHCGNTMHADGLGTNHPVYSCVTRLSQPGVCRRHAISLGALDKTTWQRIEAILTNPDVVALEVAKLRTNDPTEDDLAAIERDNAKVQRQQGNIARAIAMLESNDLDAVAPLIAELGALGKRRQQLEAEHDKILQRRAAWLATEKRLNTLQDWCHNVGARLGTFTYQEKHLALDALGVTVRVYERDHDPRYVIEANIPLDGADFMYTTSPR